MKNILFANIICFALFGWQSKLADRSSEGTLWLKLITNWTLLPMFCALENGFHAISASEITSFVLLLKWLITLLFSKTVFKSRESNGFLAVSCQARLWPSPKVVIWPKGFPRQFCGHDCWLTLHTLCHILAMKFQPFGAETSLETRAEEVAKQVLRYFFRVTSAIFPKRLQASLPITPNFRRSLIECWNSTSHRVWQVWKGLSDWDSIWFLSRGAFLFFVHSSRWKVSWRQMVLLP